MVVHHGRYVAYLRVSTDKQGIDGYGIDAQREAVRARLNGGQWKLAATFTEVESSRRKTRPELTKALVCARHRRAPDQAQGAVTTRRAVVSGHCESDRGDNVDLQKRVGRRMGRKRG